jgi:outer membrane receptor protein involved in Fe transport
MPTPSSLYLPRPLSWLALGFALSVTRLAAAVPAAPAPAADETVQLSPFIISTERETGWSANDTLSATRTKQALKDVPVNIDAITADFIEDLGLNTADEVTRFVANVYAAPTMENDNQTDNFSFRGLSQRFNVSRNYFRWYVPSDTYNVERIDFGKGSNSLIFGDVEPGGQGSVFTKRALMKNFGTLHAQYGSEGAYRVQLDLNRKLREGLALRFNAVRREEKTFQDASTYQLEGETLALTWQPLRHTMIRLEAERGDFENSRGFSGITMREQSARSLGFTSAGPWFTSDGNWFNQSSLAAADRSSTNGPAGGSLTLLEGGYYDVTMRNAAGAIVGTKRVAGYPKHYNLRGSFDRQARPFSTYSVTIEQRIGQLGLEFAYNHQNQDGLRNDNFFNSTVSLDVNGRPYIDTTGIDWKRFGNDVDAFRGTAVLPWQPFTWMKQLFIGSVEYREDFTNSYRKALYNVKRFENGLVTAVNQTNDRVRFRLYLDDPKFYSRALFDRFTLDQLPATNDFQAKQLSFGSAADGSEWRQAYAGAVSASGTYFKGRLQSLVGVRWDWNRTYEYKGTRTFGPYNEDIPPPSREDALPGEYVENPALHLFNTSYTAGLTYVINPDINIYGVYSDSFRWQDARTFDMKIFGPISGVTKEVGLKGGLFNNRLTFTLGVFNIDRQNVEFRWNPSSFSGGDVENLMNPNNITANDPGYLRSWRDVNQFRSVMSTETSKGFDLTLMARPFKGLQARFTLGKTDVTTRPDFASFRAFYDAAVKRGDEAPALIADAREVLDSSDFATKPSGARAAPWSASWILDYTFARETWAPLKGVRLGLNGSWRDSYLFGISNARELVGGTTHGVSAYVMRDQKIWGQQVRVRAGVKNLIDLENTGDARKTGFTTLASGAAVYRYTYVMPPQYDLTLTVRF